MKKDEKKADISSCPVRHVAFIMDGNGRWAQKRGLAREAGHKRGAEVFKQILKRCGELGVEAATFYVFSTENWKRPKKEVDAIMKLLENYLDECEKQIDKNNIRFVFIGDMSVFPLSISEKMKNIEKASAHNSYIANLAINYGGRDEIVHAVNTLLASGERSVSEEQISSALYTHSSPPLDLVVRTGGDLRISNFLLWQSAYAEFYFTDKLWPDLTPDDVDAILENFTKRDRRFGGV